MKKRLLILLVLFCLTLIFVGCDREEDVIENDQPETEQTGTDKSDVQDTPDIIKSESQITEGFSLEKLYEILTDSNEIAKKEEIISLLSGKSAYEIAVQNGFSGTEEEWLESLKGKDGVAQENDKYALWLIGEGGPKLSQENKNVLYFDIENGAIYQYDNDGWVKIVDFTKKQRICKVTLFYSEEEKVTKNVIFGESIELPILEKTGKKFLGWFTGESVNDAQITSYSPIVKDMILYPKFGEVKYKISYYIEEEYYAEQEYFYNEKIVPPQIFDRDDVSGWKDIPSKMPDSDITVFAIIDGKFVVRFFDENGEILKVQYVREGESATAPSLPEKEGYDFVGWNESFDSVTKDIDVTAQYTIKVFTVVFYDGDNVLKTENVQYGKNATAPEVIEKEGYDFDGWSADYSFVTSDLAVVAQFKEKEKDESNDNNNSEPSGEQEPIENQEQNGNEESGQNEEEITEYFKIISEKLYFKKDNPEEDKYEEVVLDSDYTPDMLCDVILNDEKLQKDGYGFEIDSQSSSFSLGTFEVNDECIVPIILLNNNKREECFVKVILMK